MTRALWRLTLDHLGDWWDATLCRLLGLHGRGCRARADHIPGWVTRGGRMVWTGRGRWRTYTGPAHTLALHARYRIRRIRSR